MMVSPLFRSTFFLAQLAPDGKIYINTGNGTEYLHVINYPDSIGLACNVCQHCFHLPTFNAETIPNYPNYFLGADTTSSLCDSLRLSVKPEVENFYVVVNIFPNPVKKILYVSFDRDTKWKNVKVLNTLGQEMQMNYSYIKNGEYLEVNTSSLSQGVYFLELYSEREKVVKRFVKE